MSENVNLKIRDLNTDDIKYIADYWLKSDKSFLISIGVDLNKLPTRNGLDIMLTKQINLPDSEKSSLAMILELNDQPTGHCNVNEISYGHDATMHLHLWNEDNRKKGLGTDMILKSLPVFFDRLMLNTIWCEPYALNQAPNKTLEKIGFEFVKRYVTTPGSLNFEQEVNRYKLTRVRFEKLKKTHHNNA